MKKAIMQILFYFGILMIWQISSMVLNIPEYILPSPLEIGKEISANLSLLLKHASITFFEAITGFILGTVTAIILALIMVNFKIFEVLVYPLLVMSQTTPKIAIVPFLILWFGYDLLPKIIIAAIVSFFPILVNSVKGLKSADLELLDLMKSYGATNKQVFLKVKFPYALPYIITGLKIGVAFSVIGAIVAEFVGADKGLGYLIMQGNINLDTSFMFAALVILSLLGVALYKIMSIIEKKVLYWHPSVE
ncbi:ABC transporter permease [Candidatus Woesearchaeota archaeon]|nr:ABC transporter permease [Candidatus Woesearchaeota archaeon]